RDADAEGRRRVAAVDFVRLRRSLRAVGVLLDVEIVLGCRAAPGRLEYPGLALFAGNFCDDVRLDLPCLRPADPGSTRLVRAAPWKVADLVVPPLVRDRPAPETRAAPHLGWVEHLRIAAQELGLPCGLHHLLDLVRIGHVEARLRRLRPAISDRSNDGVACR